MITRCPKCNRKLLKKDNTICSHCLKRAKEINTKENNRDLL